MDCAAHFSSINEPIFITGMYLFFELRRLEPWYGSEDLNEIQHVMSEH